MGNEDEQKLRILLDFWIKHNKEHSGEFREWAEKIDGGENGVRDELIRAAEEMDKASEHLDTARRKL